MIPGAELFKLHDTYGFTLTDSLSECRRRGIPCDMIGFALAAMEAGWNKETVIASVREAFSDNGEGHKLSGLDP